MAFTMSSTVQLGLILLSLVMAVIFPPLLIGYHDLQQGQKALEQGQPLEASRSFEHAAVLLFWRADLWERAGNAALVGGDTARAVDLLERAGALSLEGWRNLATAYRNLDRLPEAIHALERGLVQYGPQPPLLLDLGLARQTQGDFSAEQATWQAYLAVDSTNPAVHHRLGLLLSLSDPDAALQTLNTAAQLDPAYQAEVQTIRSAISLAEHQADPSQRLVVIGRGLGLLREWQLAQQAFQRAIDLNPENAEAWAWLGEASQHLGQEGGPALERAATLAPRSAPVRALYGLYWKRQQQFQKAIEQFLQAVLLEPHEPAYLVALADAYALSGDLPPALAAYQRATELAPQEATYWRLLASFCAQYHFRTLEEGVPAAQNVLSLAPDQADSYDLLGWVYLIAGQLEEARQTLQTALQLDPNHASAHLHLGMVYLETGQWSQARHHLQRAHSLDRQGLAGLEAGRLLKIYFP